MLHHDPNNVIEFDHLLAEIALNPVFKEQFFDQSYLVYVGVVSIKCFYQYFFKICLDSLFWQSMENKNVDHLLSDIIYCEHVFINFLDLFS